MINSEETGLRDETIPGHVADDEADEKLYMELVNILQNGERKLQCQVAQFLRDTLTYRWVL
jgi:hypothetical protein